MNHKRLLWLIALSAMLLFALFLLPAAAEGGEQAKDVTSECSFLPAEGKWSDGKESTYATIEGGIVLVIETEQELGGVYIVFDRMPTAPYTLNGEGHQPDYLHKYVPLASEDGGRVNRVELVFEADTSIADLYLFTPGSLPAFVQCWEPPCESADLLLAPTHADDDQLFFLGVLPEYAGERGLDVQVVYYTNHNNVHNRPHELLNGLWTVGVRSYPVIAEMKDAWDGSTETLEYGYALFEGQGFSKQELVDFWVGIIRRFTPQVIVGHDIKGEYGHPQHMVNTDTLIEALKVCGEESYVTDLPPYLPEKVYLHLYGENEIVMDWDRPLSAFGGKTAYQVSQMGYACHKSQQWTWFTRWINGKNGDFTRSTQITSYSPNRYGLYFSRVGEDTVGGDFLENVIPRSTIPPVTEPPVTDPPITDPPKTDPPKTEPVTAVPPVTDPPSTHPQSAPESGSEGEGVSGVQTGDPATDRPTGEERDGRLLLIAAMVVMGLLGVMLILYACVESRRARAKRKKKRKKSRR